MFFIASKLLNIALLPLSWIAGFLLLRLLVKSRIWKRRLALAATVLVLVFSNSFLFDEAMRLWEVEAVAASRLQPHDYGIVLTGMASYDTALQRVNFARSSDRLWQALELYHTGKIRKIVIVGGNGTFKNDDIQEAEFLRNYLLNTGLDSADVLIESQSRNTYENALHAAGMFELQSNRSSFLLITSAYHLRRAGACFRKQGLETTLYATDRMAGPRKCGLSHCLLPSAETLFRWQFLLHEIAGYIAYRAQGYL